MKCPQLQCLPFDKVISRRLPPNQSVPVSQVSEERDQVVDCAFVDGPPFSQDDELVKHLEDSGRGLVDRADDGPTFPGQLFQQRYALQR